MLGELTDHEAEKGNILPALARVLRDLARKEVLFRRHVNDPAGWPVGVLPDTAILAFARDVCQRSLQPETAVEWLCRPSENGV
jgi:hypothetical protein